VAIISRRVILGQTPMDPTPLILPFKLLPHRTCRRNRNRRPRRPVKWIWTHLGSPPP
jgi:hypothetical protein